MEQREQYGALLECGLGAEVVQLHFLLAVKDDHREVDRNVGGGGRVGFRFPDIERRVDERGKGAADFEPQLLPLADQQDS